MKSSHLHKTKYFKITNFRETHYGLEYKDGFNRDPIPFSNTGSCVPGGLYFASKKYIHRFYDFGVWIRPVSLPLDNPDFKMVSDGNKFRANMINLGKRYSLLVPETYKKFKLDMPATTSLIRTGLRYGAFEQVTQLFNQYKDEIIELNLCGLSLNKIPNGISLLTNLQILYLNNNNISEISEEVKQMPNLKELYLCNNGINFSTKKYMLNNIKIQVAY